MAIKWVYAIGFLFTLLILCFLLPKAKASKEEVAEFFYKLLVSLIVLVFFNLVQELSISQEVSALAFTGFFISMSWTCFAMFRFVAAYTRQANKWPWLIRILTGILVADSVSIVCNMFFSHVFVCRPVEYAGDTFYVTEHRWYFYVHSVILYLLIATSLFLLIRRLIQSSSDYRIKYLSALLVLAFMIMWDAFFVVLYQSPINVSIFGYAIMGVLLYYFSIVYVPNALQEHILSKVVDELNDGVVFLDADGQCVYSNQEARTIIGMDDLLPKERDERLQKWLSDLRVNTREDVIAMRTMNRGGTDRHLEIEHQRLFDKRGKYVGSLVQVQDHTKDINDLAKQRYRATHDSLTDLYNREGFYEAVHAVLEESPHIRYLMICFNFKDFKYVNSFFGMKKGDEVLCEAAKAVSAHLREPDVLGRLYADNFALLTPKEYYDEWQYRDRVNAFAQRIVESSYKLYIHLGVYEIIDPTMEVSVMCDYANLAIDTIRGDSQTSIAYYNGDMMEQVMYEREILNEFDDAIRTRQFQIYLQPQVSTQGDLIGSEALVRWIHPEKGMIPPGRFIPVLEDNGLIYRLDRYVWEEAARVLQTWKGTEKEKLYISVNISAKDIYYLNVYETFKEFKLKYDIDPAKMKLEVTESAVMQDIDRYSALVDELHSYGFEVEMDDFGNGYSSLSMLKNISVDILKIDMAFLQEAKTKERGSIILGSVITMAKNLGMPVITEGVETEEQVQLLTMLGSDMFQGYYFARPMPVSEFESRYFGDGKETASA